MPEKSANNSVKVNNCEPPQWLKATSLDTSVKLAGEEAKDRLYEPKHKKKLVRVLTVVAYIFFVSLAAIMLSLYYVFLWNGYGKEIKTGQELTLESKMADHTKPCRIDGKPITRSSHLIDLGSVHLFDVSIVTFRIICLVVNYCSDPPLNSSLHVLYIVSLSFPFSFILEHILFLCVRLLHSQVSPHLFLISQTYLSYQHLIFRK